MLLFDNIPCAKLDFTHARIKKHALNQAIDTLKNCFLCDGGSKIRFLIGPMRFYFISNFRFSQNYFFLFFNDRIEIFESDG